MGCELFKLLPRETAMQDRRGIAITGSRETAMQDRRETAIEGRKGIAITGISRITALRKRVVLSKKSIN